MGVFLAGSVVIPLVAGLLLDGALHMSPLFLIIGLLVGILAAGMGVYVRFRRYL